MKVILLKELKGRGGEGDVIDVAPGFARNYLIPQKIAIMGTKGNLKQLELRKHNIAKREEARIADAEAKKAQLEGLAVTIPVSVGEEGQLFGSVTPQMIADAIKEAHDIDVDRKRIDIHGTIKQTGDHEAVISIYRDIKSVVKLKVVDENAAADQADEEAPAAEAEETPKAEEAPAAEEAAEAEEAPAEAEEASAEE
ncbi:MAG: 50S ribosomal protein L9 [Eggerthellaceae bacterium]|jgi:large subunit ribosomal protein L9